MTWDCGNITVKKKIKLELLLVVTCQINLAKHAAEYDEQYLLTNYLVGTYSHVFI